MFVFVLERQRVENEFNWQQMVDFNVVLVSFEKIFNNHSVWFDGISGFLKIMETSPLLELGECVALT